MEKTDQKKVEYMMENSWIDTRLNQEEMDFLWGCISEENKSDYRHELAGNISKSEKLVDKDNWFFKSAIKKLTERLFYKDWDVYYKYHIEKEEPLPVFEMDTFWVNYQKQHEFNPIHLHTGCLYSYVVFMKIPIHWKEQHALPISVNSTVPSASDFVFVWSGKESDIVLKQTFHLSSEDEGRMLFFPSSLKHLVYPFYECEEERITISGNIELYDPNRPKMQEIPVGEYKEKENMLKIMEIGVESVKKELEQMKKEREKDGTN